MTPWNFNLRHLRAVAAIVRLGSVTAASQSISISQPAITQGLARIETQLGIALFQRTSDGMKAETPALILAPRAEAALKYIASPRVTMPQMRAFLALSHAGSYAEAAIETGLAEPSLHRAVADLSVSLGKSLVERRGRGISLSVEGRLIARRFRLAKAELDAALAELLPWTGLGRERIAIGAMPLARARILPAAVSRFHAAFPAVAIRIIEGAFHELVEPLRDGDLDMMIGALRQPVPARDLSQRALFADRPVILARKDHPATSAALSELARFGWIMPERGTPLRDQWEKMFQDASLEAPHVAIECGSVITIRQLLLAGDALTMLSRDQLAVELDAGLLREVAPAPDGTDRIIGITTRTGWRPTAVQAAFLEELDRAVPLAN
jgi:LysR family transcriptional regulator, regulator for genes of the gallate degradation pathway